MTTTNSAMRWWRSCTWISIGPAQGDDEVIETIEGTLEAPLDRYVMGTLWPNADDNRSEAPDVPDGVSGNDSETVVDSPVPAVPGA